MTGGFWCISVLSGNIISSYPSSSMHCLYLCNWLPYFTAGLPNILYNGRRVRVGTVSWNTFFEGKTGKVRRRRRIRKQLLDDLKEKSSYWVMKEETLYHTLWRTRFVGQTTWWWWWVWWWLLLWLWWWCRPTPVHYFYKVSVNYSTYAYKYFPFSIEIWIHVVWSHSVHLEGREYVRTQQKCC